MTGIANAKIDFIDDVVILADAYLLYSDIIGYQGPSLLGTGAWRSILRTTPLELQRVNNTLC